MKPLLSLWIPNSSPQHQTRTPSGCALRALLARDEVRAVFLQHGISPAEAEARVLAMMDAEILQVNDAAAQLPAGGAGEIAMSFPVWAYALSVAAVLAVALLIFWTIYYVTRPSSEQKPQSYAAPPASFSDPARVVSLPGGNPAEPWTGKWKVQSGKFGGVWALKQTGNQLVSTPGSDYVVDATVVGATVSGTWSERGGPSRSTSDFKATISDDGSSFMATGTRMSFTAVKVE